MWGVMKKEDEIWELRRRGFNYKDIGKILNISTMKAWWVVRKIWERERYE